MKLSPRLEKIIEHTLVDKRLADIGTDHAFIPIELIKRGILDSAIATDINEGPLNRAKLRVEENGLGDNIKLRLGSGLEVLESEEVEQIVIAGMGAKEISQIIDNDFNKAVKLNRLILNPMTNVSELREYLFKNGFRIVKDITVKETNHYYQILIVNRGEPDYYTTYDLEYGYLPVVEINEDYISYLDYQMRLLRERIEKMRNSKNDKTRRRRQEFERRLIFLSNRYESIKNSIHN